MIKHCVICGKAFSAPPSSKKVTCSPACRSIRAARAAKTAERHWSQEAKTRRANDPDMQKRMSELQSVGAAAALELPEGQRGPLNRESKDWILIDPTGQLVPVHNLLDWARKNYTLFEPASADPEEAAVRIRSGFNAIACTLRRAPSRVKHPITSYKGWGLLGIPQKLDKKDD